MVITSDIHDVCACAERIKQEMPEIGVVVRVEKEPFRVTFAAPIANGSWIVEGIDTGSCDSATFAGEDGSQFIGKSRFPRPVHAIDSHGGPTFHGSDPASQLSEKVGSGVHRYWPIFEGNILL
jgi:hypothetical protein